MSDESGVRYIVVSTPARSGVQRYALLDAHAHQLVKSDRSPLIAVSDARLLNEHATGLPAAGGESVTRVGTGRDVCRIRRRLAAISWRAERVTQKLRGTTAQRFATLSIHEFRLAKKGAKMYTVSGVTSIAREGGPKKIALGTLLIVGLLSLVGSVNVGTARAAVDIISTPDVAGIHPDSTQQLAGSASDTNSGVYSQDSLATDASTADDAFHEDGMHIHVHAHHLEPNQPDPRSSSQQQLDWCRYNGFASTASDLSGDSNLNVFQDLVSNLQTCFDSYFPGDPYNGTYAAYIALQNESQLLFALYPGSTVEQVATTIDQGVTLPTQTWINWLNASAAAVPPVT